MCHCVLAVAQCIVIGPVSGFVCLWVCYHDNSKLRASIFKLGLSVKVVTISSWLNFGRPVPPGRGSAAGWKILAPPYYSQRAMFASPLSAFFITVVTLLCRADCMKKPLSRHSHRFCTGYATYGLSMWNWRSTFTSLSIFSHVVCLIHLPDPCTVFTKHSHPYTHHHGDSQALSVMRLILCFLQYVLCSSLRLVTVLSLCCLLVVLVRLSVPVQVTDGSFVSCNVLMGH